MWVLNGSLKIYKKVIRDCKCENFILLDCLMVLENF